MSLSSIGHGGQCDTNFSPFDRILREAFAGEIICFFSREPACTVSCRSVCARNSRWCIYVAVANQPQPDLTQPNPNYPNPKPNPTQPNPTQPNLFAVVGCWCVSVPEWSELSRRFFLLFFLGDSWLSGRTRRFGYARVERNSCFFFRLQQ